MRFLAIVLSGLTLIAAASATSPPGKRLILSGSITLSQPKAPTATPSPTPSPSPTPFLAYDANIKPTFVLAPNATNAALGAQLTIAVTQELRKEFFTRDGPTKPRDPAYTSTFIAEPTWQLADYMMECATSNAGSAAIVILPPSERDATENYFAFTRQWQELDVDVAGFDCVKGIATVVWVPNKTFSGIGTRDAVNFLPIGATFAAFSLLRKQSSTKNITDLTYASPSPYPPSPSASYPSGGTQEIDTSGGVDSNGLGNLIVVGGSLFPALAQGGVNPGSAPSVDAQSAKAAERIAFDFAKTFEFERGNCTAKTTILWGCATATPPAASPAPARKGR